MPEFYKFGFEKKYIGNSKKDKNFLFVETEMITHTVIKMLSRFSNFGNCGINFWTTLENASKIL